MIAAATLAHSKPSQSAVEREGATSAGGGCSGTVTCAAVSSAAGRACVAMLAVVFGRGLGREGGTFGDEGTTASAVGAGKTATRHDGSTPASIGTASAASRAVAHTAWRSAAGRRPSRRVAPQAMARTSVTRQAASSMTVRVPGVRAI